MPGLLPPPHPQVAPVIELASQLSLVLIAVTMGILGLLILLRLRMRAMERLRQDFLAVWRPLLHRSLLEMPETLPALSEHEWPLFLGLWNQLHESLRGESKTRLNELAQTLGAGPVAMRYLRRGTFQRRFLALQTLGNLQERGAWERLQETLTSSNAFLSLMAMRAMLQIDPEAALPLVTSLIASRTDWSAARVGTILQAAGPDRVGGPLAEAAQAAKPAEAVRLIRLLDAIHAPMAVPTARRLLETADAPDLLATCLRLVPDRSDLAAVRRLTAHSAWQVRMEAASALGRLGERQDVPRLIELLSDSQWWVRYRAAQALVSLPFLDRSALLALGDQLQERSAANIFTQVLTERQMA